MKIVRESSPNEAVLVWLQAELKSARFQNELQKSLVKYSLAADIITKPDLDNALDNESRLKILKNYRNWFKDDVYTYAWQLVALKPEEIKQLRYIDYSYWNELSDNTRRVSNAAENVRRGKTAFDVSNDNFFSIAQAAEAGVQFPPLIVLEKKQMFEIIEGHARATGYLLANFPTKPLRALIGFRSFE